MPKILHRDPFIAVTELNCAVPDPRDLDYTASAIVNPVAGPRVDQHRTSDSYFDWGQLQDFRANILLQIQQDFGHIYNPSQCENLVISRYQKGQLYASHLDYWDNDNPRCATALVYFNDDFLGGNTYFDRLNITVRPKKNQLLYWTYPADSPTRELTWHTGMHVVGGVKYVATLWIRTNSL